MYANESDFKDLPRNEEILSSIESLSDDSSDAEIVRPLDIFDCDPALWSSDSEFFPSETDASETDERQFRVGELDLIAFGEPRVFLRYVPRAIASWNRCKVLEYVIQIYLLICILIWLI